MDKVMDKVCDMFHDVLYTLAERGSFKDESDVMTAKAAVSGIVKIKTLEAMERYEGGSFRGRSYEDNRSYERYGRDEGSYRRGRGMDGRYVSRDGDIKEHLRHLMQEAEGHDKEIIQEMLGKM